MKGYFCKFLEDFQFPDGAKTQLVAVYDELCEKGGVENDYTLTEEEKDAVFFGNAQRLLNI